MKAKTLLRIASILMLLHTTGHTIGALTWKDAPNARVAAVVAGMQNEHFRFMGRSLTLASFFEGYGFGMIGVLLLVSILLWLLSTAFNRRMIWVMGIFLIGFGVNELIFFFPFAAAFSLLAGILTLSALWRK
ncbi:hypothetical protein [Mucilaginibacter sp.]|jgi:hypothetical protein|uniref:LIC_13387 family protein n=1 Tax=Mucilaginibacter sp. TaxID=1882438 RepID=UPI0035690714